MLDVHWARNWHERTKPKVFSFFKFLLMLLNFVWCMQPFYWSISFVWRPFFSRRYDSRISNYNHFTSVDGCFFCIQFYKIFCFRFFVEKLPLFLWKLFFYFILSTLASLSEIKYLYRFNSLGFYNHGNNMLFL